MYGISVFKDTKTGKTVKALNKEEARVLMGRSKAYCRYYIYDIKFEECSTIPQ